MTIITESQARVMEKRHPTGMHWKRVKLSTQRSKYFHVVRGHSAILWVRP